MARRLLTIFLWAGIVTLTEAANAQFFPFTFLRQPPAGGGPSCPTNYVLVPALASYTTEDFCVAKYEMKNVSTVATSQPELVPWDNITQANAVTACTSLGGNYDMITNAQWQTIARNLVLVASNWSSGTVGTGSVNRGHSDNNPSGKQVASGDDTLACTNTGQTCSDTVWDTQRRTFKLSNDEVIWDFSGNVHEWVKDADSFDYGATAMISQITYASHTATGPRGRVAKDEFGPAGDYTSLNSGEYGGLGQYYWLSFLKGRITRGGAYDGQTNNGIFRTNRATSGGAVTGTGFRCVYNP